MQLQMHETLLTFGQQWIVSVLSHLELSWNVDIRIECLLLLLLSFKSVEHFAKFADAFPFGEQQKSKVFAH